MSAPSGYVTPHRYLVISHDGDNEVLEFQESGARPTVAFTDEYIRVGCHKISRAAWELLNKKYEHFIGKTREEILQKGTY